eukprot:Trichotokara_eunicae@DN5167_c0_g1_i1.p1
MCPVLSVPSKIPVNNYLNHQKNNRQTNPPYVYLLSTKDNDTTQSVSKTRHKAAPFAFEASPSFPSEQSLTSQVFIRPRTHNVPLPIFTLHVIIVPKSLELCISS